MAESNPTNEIPQWQLDLERVGFVRRALMARKWYGGDWWFVVISAILLLFVIIVGIFPQWFAPYDPRAEVGPSLLAPGQPPADYVLLAPADREVQTLRDIGSSQHQIGFVLASPASQALREALDELNQAEEAQDSSVRYQPRPQRYETLAEGLADLEAGQLDGFVATAAEADAATLAQYPGV
ncbi:MAG: hypothetical protein GYA30_11105, partial [Chloroflexi bacterium]|nr:hypothetical protein [Chloroflexota bacterium]